MTRPLIALLFALPLALEGAACSRANAEPPVPRASAPASPAPAGATAPASSAVYVRPPTAELRARLTALQFEVTQEAATEPPFRNEYWNNHQAGIYVDIVSGEPLFSSQDKFESGTGWPSFTQPIEPGRVVEHSDTTLGMTRTELTSKGAGSHLGHVFDDGPAPLGTRYCIDSASLRFIPVDRLVAEGYGPYASRFGAAASSAPPPAASVNACASPKPGEAPGCAATLDVAVFGQAKGDDAAAKVPGVLDVATGYEGDRPAIQVTFDPKVLPYGALLDAWSKGRAKPAVYAQDATQKTAATQKGLPVVDAVPFRRQ